MAIGHEEYKEITNKPPYSQTKKKELTSGFRPTTKHLRVEVLRRAHFMKEEIDSTAEAIHNHPLYSKGRKLRMPQPSQWNTEKLTSWLMKNTISLHQKDELFLRSRIANMANCFNKQSELERSELRQIQRHGHPLVGITELYRMYG